MSGQADTILNAGADPTASSSSDKPATRAAVMLSIIGLIAGVIALALATIPAVAMNHPLPNPFTDNKKVERPVEPPVEREGGVTLKFKGVSVQFGGKVPKKAVQPAAPP